MSSTFIACASISILWMGIFYLWGKSFLKFICVEQDVASCICFGYHFLQVVYQIVYLPVYLTRGSYRVTVWVWLIFVGVASIILIKFVLTNSISMKPALHSIERVGICITSLIIMGLAFFISLHVPFYGQDTLTYISAMNESFSRDTIWVSTRSTFHYGMSSMYQFFTIPSIITNINPYYISLFTVRIVGVSLFALTTYRIGVLIYREDDKFFSWFALLLSILSPFLIMFWGSQYTAEFFYWRINEAKGFCQFVLLPLSFSVFLSMLKKNANRSALWKEQIILGMAAVPVSASSLTPYLFLVLLGVFAMLGHDMMKKGWKTIEGGIICALPNLLYLLVYILDKRGFIAI